jgi:hypothetical protein
VGWRRFAPGAVVVLVAATSVGLNTGFSSPPRFDGAGYSVLALSLIEGRGYREIDRPDAPRHAHFPPGYPMALAALWKILGPSVVAAHVFSMICTVAASWLAWRWFRRIEPRGVADALGVALAVNWMWGAVGGAIQSEGLYLFLSMAAVNLARARGWRASLGLGALLGLCVLTRHVAVGLLGAVVIDRLWVHSSPRHPNAPPQRGRGLQKPSPVAGEGRAGGRRVSLRDVAVILFAAAIIISPWLYWLATVRRNTQVALLDATGIVPRVASQALFYVRRVPDALTGPFVEVATVFSRSRTVGIAATSIAVVISAVILIGLLRCTIDPRRRLSGLVPLVTLPLLLAWPFTEAGRFLIPLVPFLLVGMTEGLAWIFGLFPRTTPHPDPPPQGGRESEHPPDLRGSTRWGVGWGISPRRLASLLVLLVAIPYPAYALLTHRAEAQQRSHADFDAACAWIAREAKRPGPVLTRHPGEVFWQTGRLVVLPASNDPASLVSQIHDDNVAYILVDLDRFANAPSTPLARLVAERPDRARHVFGDKVAVYEVRRDSGP